MWQRTDLPRQEQPGDADGKAWDDWLDDQSSDDEFVIRTADD